MKKDVQLYVILLLSIFFIPAAYLFVAAVFAMQIRKGDYKQLILIKNNKMLVAVVCYIFTGTVFSHYLLISSLYSTIMLICLYAAVITYESMDYIDISSIIKFVYIMSLISFVIGIIQFLSPQFSIPDKWVDVIEYRLNKRVYSTFFNPNIFGFYINIILITVSMNMKENDRLSAAVFVTGILCLFLTFSRTSWISLVAALVFAGIFFDKKYFKFALLIAIVLIGLDKMFKTGRIDPSRAAGDSSILYRFEIWKSCFEIIKDNLIAGIGFGTLSKHILSYSNVVKSNVEHCHNFYIQVVTETGVLGLLISTYIFYNLLKNFRHKINKTSWAVVVMVLIHGLVDSVFFTPQILMILSIYTGIVINYSDTHVVSGSDNINECCYNSNQHERKAG